MNYNNFQVNLYDVPSYKTQELVDAISAACSLLRIDATVSMWCESEHWEVTHKGFVRDDGSIRDADFKQMVRSEANLFGDLTEPSVVVFDAIQD